MASENQDIIFIDVGGTNTRIYRFDGKTLEAEKICVFRPKNSRELKSRVVKEVVRKERRSLKKIGICACFAGRVLKDGKKASVTNWGETFNIEKLFDFLDSKRGVFVNDAEAAIVGLDFIKEKIKKEIVFGRKENIIKKPFSLLYLGTGLGAAVFYDSAIVSEFSALKIPFTDGEKKQLKIKKEFLFDDLVSGRGLSTIAKILYERSLTPEKISEEILKGKMEEAGKIFARVLGRAAKNFALTIPAQTIFLGGKPTEPFVERFYKEFIKEFLSDKINSWWLKEIAILKLDPNLDLPFEGLKFLATKMIKEKRD